MSWKLAALMALTVTATAEARPATSASAPQAVNLAGACAYEVVPAGALCEVVGMAILGEAGGVPLNWGLYEITGKGRTGLSVLLITDDAGRSKVAATLPVPAEEVEAWREDPYVVAAIVEQDGEDYAAMSVRGADGPAAFSVHRIDAAGLTAVDSASLWPVVQTKLSAVTRSDCYPVGGDINWRTFGLRYDMMSDAGSCGTAFLDLGVESGALTVTDALAVQRETTPGPRRRRGRR